MSPKVREEGVHAFGGSGPLPLPPSSFPFPNNWLSSVLVGSTQAGSVVASNACTRLGDYQIALDAVIQGGQNTPCQLIHEEQVDIQVHG
jgi:hypothetical protein